MKKLKYIFILLVLVIQYNIKAQRVKFTTDTAFINEIYAYFPVPEKGEVNPTLGLFANFWKSGQLTLNQKEQIILISNQLLKKRIKPVPQFENYLKIVLSVNNSQVQRPQLANWLRFLTDFTFEPDNNSNTINRVFENFLNLADSSSFYKSAALEWKYNSNDYKLLYEANSEARFFFNKTDIICYSKRDSALIKDTKGYYFPISDRWVGTGGLVTWERCGLSKDSVFAKLSNYRINLKLPEYQADSVDFVNKKYFKGNIKGRLAEKVLANAVGEKASYPKFESYESKVDLKKVVPNIDFSGGFSMSGAKFIGFGDSLNNAELFIYKKNELFAKASSKSFVFGKENVFGSNTKIRLYIDNDSIWHPGLDFNYLIKEQKLALNRKEAVLNRSKFYDTYHKLEIEASEISIKLDDSVLYFKSPPASTFKRAVFISSSFFSEESYGEIDPMAKIDPLEIIRDKWPTAGEEIEIKKLAYHIKKSTSQCADLLTMYSDYGFVNFDPGMQTAYPLQKLYDYVDAHKKKKDYDAIRIISEPPTGNNAVLNLKNNQLSIYGVKPFPLSDNRRVGIYPKDNTININKDLEIDFDGKLKAGLANLYGKDMTFYYDSFYIKLESVDSLALFYRSEEKTKDSTYEYSLVKSTIDSITGLLRIDNPVNKSGEQTIANYPIFESHQKSYVFYDVKSEKDTIYRKQDFFFENFPFEIDSLNTITKNNVRIEGIFKSGAIFPDLKEVLLVQPDSSLGFVHSFSDSSMMIYNGLGTYNNALSLNNSGLKGEGKVSYLNTLLYSGQFNFFPDSMNAYTNRMEMNKQTKDSLPTAYPQAYSDSTYVHWEPTKDQMIVKSLKEPINLFEDKSRFEGNLTLKPTDLKGKGTLTFVDANLKSDTYTFFDESFKADTADFKLQPVQGQESPFLTYNVNAEVNFDNKLGMFKSNGNNSYIDFPVNQFKCYMNYFSWHMGINQIDIGYLQGLKNDSINNMAMVDSLAVDPAEENIESYQVELNDTSYTAEELAANSKFVSTHPNQDSLSFYATSTSYDITNFIIKAKGVKFINVADAHIFPSSPVFIEQNAKIRPLNNSRIVANRETRYHKFFDATVQIKGAKNYSGSGDYEYIDRLDSLQIIHFNNILVDKDVKTFANGDIARIDSFKLGPEFSYFGRTKIIADHPNIEFEGYTKIDQACNKRLQSYWLHFDSEIEPDSIVIPIEKEPKDNDMRKLQTGLYVSLDSIGVYSSFLSTKRRFTDVPVLEAGGFLYYNKLTGYFEITDSSKLNNPEKEGNYLSFHKKLCLVLAEGKMDFGAKFGQVKLSPVGAIRQNLDSWGTTMEIMLPVDFFFNDLALNEMGKVINENYTLDPVNPSKKEYRKAFKELVGLERLNQLTKDFSLLGTFETVPVEMKHTLFFSKVQMKWNNEQTAWQSVGKIGIGNLNGLQINKLVDGYIEVKRAKIGDILNIYLEIDPKKWFFFTYTRGTLKTISSEDGYNKTVINLKDRDRKSPIKDDDNPYMFYPATDKAKENFVAEMKRQQEKAKEDKDINLDNNIVSDKNPNTEETESETEEEEINGTDNNSEEIELEDVKENKNGQNNNEVKQEETNTNKEIKENENATNSEENKNKKIINEENKEIKTENTETNDPNKNKEIKENPKEEKKEIKEEEEENIPLEGGEEEEEEGEG